MNIQELVRQHYTKWMEVKKHTLPDLADCLDFMTTEVGEAIDKRLRQNPAYFRNNPEDVPSNVEIGVEIFDAIMMGCIALDLMGLDLEEIAKIKLERMDKKRGF